jgi:hypothetical protein
MIIRELSRKNTLRLLFVLEQTVESRMGWINTNATGHYTMARCLSRSFLELALTRTDPHRTGAIQTAEGIKIHATVGHQTPTCTGSGVVY